MSDDVLLQRGAALQSSAVDHGAALREAAVARAQSLGGGAVANAAVARERLAHEVAPPALPEQGFVAPPVGAAAHAAAVSPTATEVEAEAEPVR